MSERGGTVRVLGRVVLALWFGAVAAFCCRALLPADKVLTTQANDLAVHVRHAYEAGLALEEGQFPPLVAPALDHGTRVPVFQYYSGTSYLLPGLAVMLGVPPYPAVTLSVFLHLAVAGAFIYLCCRELGLTRPAALVAGTAYQVFPFAACDLISRGSYTEFIALEFVPVVFYCCLRVLRATRREDIWLWIGAASICLAYFVPLHPLQTLLCGAMVTVLLGAYAAFDLKSAWRASVRLAAVCAFGLVASAWFWFPIARDRATLRVAPHSGFLDAGLARWDVLLWPVFRQADPPWPWAPQLGVHFAIAAVVVLATVFWWRRERPRALGLASALSLTLAVVVIHWYDAVPLWLYRLLKPLQWTYRLLIPGALAGALCLALAFDVICDRFRGRAGRAWPGWVVAIALIAYVVGIAPPYFHGQAEQYLMLADDVVSPHFAPVTTHYYAMLGTDYRLLRFTRPDGSLNAGAALPIPPEGFPTRVEMVLEPEGSSPAADIEVLLGDPTNPADVRHPDRVGIRQETYGPESLTWADPAERVLEKTTEADGTLRLAFSFVPTVGMTPGDTAIRFESRPAGVNWKVLDVTFRGVDEPALRACRIPDKLERVRDGRRLTLSLGVAPGKAGLYQLPVYFLRSNEVLANGVREWTPRVRNGAMVIVPLREGRNVVRIRTCAAGAARVSGAVLAALAAGVVVLAARRAPVPVGAWVSNGLARVRTYAGARLARSGTGPTAERQLLLRPTWRLSTIVNGHRLLLGAWFVALALSACLPVARTRRVLVTQANDLAHHARHAYEFGLALREGQVPPLVAPEMDGRIRVPVFQYYSLTAYALPGTAVALLRMHPYEALKLSIFLHVLAAGVFAYKSARALGVGRAAAIVAGTAYELFPFAGVDLFGRGAYSEFTALEATPLVFYLALKVVQSARPRAPAGTAPAAAAPAPPRARLWFCLASLAWAYFIPLHPVQTVLCGGLVFVLLAAHSLLDLKTTWRGPAAVLGTIVCGSLASAWFWVPVARDYADLRITPHAGFFDAGLASFPVLLWPVYREMLWRLWAPQLGLHFAVAAAAVLVLWPRPGRAIGAIAALSLVAIIVLIRWYDSVPYAAQLLKPLQWTYRLLVPAALAGTVCLALAFDAIHRRLSGAGGLALYVIVLAYVVGISPWYFAGRGRQYGTPRDEVLSPHYVAVNTTGSYVLRGTDYARLGLVKPPSLLNTGVRLPIPGEGYRTEIRLVLRTDAGAASAAGSEVRPDVDVLIDTAKNPGVSKTWIDGALHLGFSIMPHVGHVAGNKALRFVSSPPETRWRVQDVTFHSAADPSGWVCRVPEVARRTRDGKRLRYNIEVAPGKAGLYQLPVCHLPSNTMEVNGNPLSPLPMVNRAMVVAPLREGVNDVQIRTRPAAAAWLVSAGACIALAIGAARGAMETSQAARRT